MKRLVVINGIEWHLVKVGKYWHAQRWVDGRRKTRTTKQTSQDRAIDAIRAWDESSGGVLTERVLSDWLQRRENRRGEPLSPQTTYEAGLHWRQHISPVWGGKDVAEITPEAVEDWADGLKVSSRYRQAIVSTMKGMIDELRRRGYTTTAHMADVQKGASQKPAVFTRDNIDTLFSSPAVWRREGEPEWLGRMLMSIFGLMTFGGLRPQEARAVHADQVLPKMHAVLVTRSITGTKTVSEYMKTGSDRNPRYRGTLLSQRGWDIFYQWAGDIDRGPLYTLDGILRKEFLRDRLRYACEANGIEGRIIPYSCRYTYVSRYKSILDESVLMSMVGHVDKAMPERYHRPYLIEQMEQLQGIREILDRADQPKD